MKPPQFTDLAAYLASQEKKSLLRFLTCGSVDDGKSTLIGRLLYDSKLIFEDHLTALSKDSKKHGTTGEDIDLALLVDGLEAERQQGITIDVAFRFFSTAAEKSIVGSIHAIDARRLKRLEHQFVFSIEVCDQRNTSTCARHCRVTTV